MKLRRPFFVLAAMTAPLPLHAQSVVVDEGTFTVTVNGRDAGTETFAIRRSGLGNEGTVLAHGVVTLSLEGGRQEVRPILEAIPTNGTTTRYQVTVSGAEELQASLALAGNRYVSEFRSPAGEEEREFLARPATHVLDVMVAHQYYFMRGVLEGSRATVIEPRTRRSISLEASGWEDDEISLGRNRVPARRVTFGVGDDARTVWYDGQGRVLRVAVPSLGYVAEREDLVG
jgi:hypothetical protein